MAYHAANGMLGSGARLKRQARVRNEAVADIVDWCLSEVASFSKANGMRPQAHGDQVRPALEAFMRNSREKLTFEAFGPAVTKAIAEILDKADAHHIAELDEFAVGAWRPREPGKETSVTNNNVNNYGGTVGSVQQGGDGAQQVVTTFDVAAMRQALDAFEQATASVELPAELRQAIAAEVDTLRPQLKKPTPSEVIVRESFKTLRSLVEGVAAGTLTSAFVALATAAAPLMGVS